MSDDWWRGAVIYQIYPRSFQDSSGDGVGDLRGIQSRLNYIADLGVDAIWISPFFTSPMKDFGYDVSDYRDVDPLFGTISDFEELVDRAHALNLKVMIDQVWSHTSDQHAWFKESRQNTGNPKADWYTWADAKPDGTPPNNWLSVFGGAAWTWDTRRQQYYLHNFLKEQPDLNFHNPDVQNAILDVAKFWLDLGVDGFRLDVCNFYFQDRLLRDNPVRENLVRGPNPHDWQAHTYCRNQPENLAFLSQLRSLTDAYGKRCLMGEIGDINGLPVLLDYTEGTDRLHTAYCFDFLSPNCDSEYLRKVLQNWTEAGRGWPTWALGNHDFPRVASRWTSGDPSDDQLRLFAAFQFSLNGTLCLYQGEELGLEQVDIPFEKIQDPEGKAFWPEKPGRDGCRTPMPWTPEAPHGGFSSAAETWLPQLAAHRAKAASSQVEAPDSLHNFYRKMIRYRANEPALRSGDLRLIETVAPLLAFIRKTKTRQLCCIFNFSDMPSKFAAPPEFARIAKSNNCGLIDHTVQMAPWGWAILEEHANE